VTTASLREESSHYNGVKQKTFARWQKHTVKKDIHTANEEEQAKICRKLKEVLSYTVGGYTMWATLRAEIAKGPPLLTPRLLLTMLTSRRGL
jgi:hypothetical protein